MAFGISHGKESKAQNMPKPSGQLAILNHDQLAALFVQQSLAKSMNDLS